MHNGDDRYTKPTLGFVWICSKDILHCDRRWKACCPPWRTCAAGPRPSIACWTSPLAGPWARPSVSWTEEPEEPQLSWPQISGSGAITTMDFGKFGIHLEWTYSDLILGEYYTTQHRLRVNITQHHNTGSTYTSAIWRKALRRQKDIAIYIIYIHLIGRVCWSIQCFLASDHCGLDKNWSSIIRSNHVIDS